MQLCIDIGNTRIKLAVFDKDEIIHFDIITKMSHADVVSFIKKFKIKKAISSSTRKRITSFEKHVKAVIPLLRLNHNTPIPIENTYLTPKTLGKDRLAGVIACTRLYPNKTCLVIDAGTCITYDVIEKGKIYLGGNIAPGMWMRAEAMDKMTSALPMAEPKHHEDFLGKNTIMALQNGVVYGTLCEMESFIAMVREKFGEINVIITGGDANIFANLLKSKIFVHSNLVLIGLDVILDYNAV